MINNTLYHEVAIMVQSGSDFVNPGELGDINKNYASLQGSFYGLISIANQNFDPTGSVLPANYTGSIMFDIPRYKLGGVFGEFSAPQPYNDLYGCNALEMTLTVESISSKILFDKNPSFFHLRTAAVTTDTLGNEFTIGPVSDKVYLNNVDEDWNVNGGGFGAVDNYGNDAQWFGLTYNDLEQKFQLNYWFSQINDIKIVKGIYQMY